MKRHDFSPEPAHVKDDDGYGDQLYEFLVDYPYGDGTYCATIWAYDQADAERRLASIRANGEVMGQIYATGEVASMAVN